MCTALKVHATTRIHIMPLDVIKYVFDCTYFGLQMLSPILWQSLFSFGGCTETFLCGYLHGLSRSYYLKLACGY